MPVATLSGGITLSTTFQTTVLNTGTAPNQISPTVNNPSYSSKADFSGGVGTTGASEANLLYAKVLTIAASASTTLDLTALTDNFTQTANFARIKCILIENISANITTEIVIGNAATNAFLGWLGGTTPTVTILAGESYFVGGATAAGKVTDATHKNLLITNSSGANIATYRITLVGANA